MGVLEDNPEVLRQREPKRGWLLPVSMIASLAAAVMAWQVFGPRRDAPTRVFESESLGCRFEYPSGLLAGPNFVRTASGAFLTIERHSLVGAKKDFVAGLPDVLFPQVMIQLDQGYRDIREIARTHGQIAGRRSLQVRLEGFAGTSTRGAVVTVDLFANDDWVYVLRSYSPRAEHEREREGFDLVRRTFAFFPQPVQQQANP